jgi:ankyrin repeat protein
MTFETLSPVFTTPQDQMTALHHAAVKGYEDVVRYLLHNGAAVSAKDEVRS